LLELSENTDSKIEKPLLARASSMHAVSAMHSAANSLLERSGCMIEPKASLLRKFDHFIQKQGVVALPEEDDAVLQELDELCDLLYFPGIARAEIGATETGNNRIEYQRTSLKKFNLEVIGWVPEYAACILILGNRFLYRLLYEYCEFDRDRIEVLLGHHESREDSYYVRVGQDQVGMIQKVASSLANTPRLKESLESPRWKLEAEMLEFQLL